LNKTVKTRINITSIRNDTGQLSIWSPGSCIYGKTYQYQRKQYGLKVILFTFQIIFRMLNYRH